MINARSLEDTGIYYTRPLLHLERDKEAWGDTHHPKLWERRIASNLAGIEEEKNLPAELQDLAHEPRSPAAHSPSIYT